MGLWWSEAHGVKGDTVGGLARCWVYHVAALSDSKIILGGGPGWDRGVREGKNGMYGYTSGAGSCSKRP